MLYYTAWLNACLKNMYSLYEKNYPRKSSGPAIGYLSKTLQDPSGDSKLVNTVTTDNSFGVFKELYFLECRL